MSYILDALKKSEQQRQLGATPTLQSAPSLNPAREPRRAWTLPVLALALAGVAFGIGWLRPWRTEPAAAPVAAEVAPPPAPTSPAAAPTAAAPTEAASIPHSRPAPPVASQKSRAAPADAVRAAAASQPPASLPQDTGERPAPKRAAAAPSGTSGTGTSGTSGASDTSGKAAEEKVLALADLPATLRAELPAMSITVHSYSPTAKERLVGVNNRLLREGDTLTSDLVLEKVTPDGMVFTFKGTRFHRGLR